MKKNKMWIIIGIAIVIFWVIGTYSKKEAGVKGQTEQKEESKVIAGASPVDFYLNLEKRGYKIDKELSGSKGCFWYCTKSESGIDYNVTVASSAPGEVEQVKITASLNGSDPGKQIIAVKPFLKYVSSFPYDGNNPSELAEWIETNFNTDKASTIIGGVKFTLSANKNIRLIYVEKA